MNETFWNIVFAVGVAQGVFLVGVLLVRRAANRRAVLLLAAIVGVFTTMILGGLVTGKLAETSRLLIVFLNINTELAIGPLFLLFVRALLDPNRRLTRRDAWHFVPMVIGMFVWGSVWAGLGDTERRFAFLESSVVPIYVFLKAVWLFSYAVASIRTLKYDPGTLRLAAPGLGVVQLAWLRRALAVLFGVAGCIYATYFAGRFGVDLPFESDPLGSFVLATMIYLATLLVMQRPWLFALRPRPTHGTRWAGDASRLQAYLEKERPWLEPEMSLGDLAAALGSTSNRVSMVIREGLGTSFYTLVNRYRLAEFERLARDPGRKDRSVLDLAFEAGFNSKASFYRVFREKHGITPAAYRSAV